MSFTSDLDVRILSGGDRVLIRPLEYQSREGNYTAPAGFVTDFASIPQVLRSLLDSRGTEKAATLHDYLYRKQVVPRAMADRLFYDALRSCGVGWIKARLLWAGVRVGGWASY